MEHEEEWSKEGWSIVPFEEAHGREVCSWRYPAPYMLYNWPEWEQMCAKGEEFADETIRREQFAAVQGESGRLAGFAQFFLLQGECGSRIVRLGLGLKPELCGQGRGAAFVRLLAQEAKRRVPGCEVDLEVLVWNERAIRTYRKAGFTLTDTYVRDTPTGPDRFHCMVYDESQLRE